MRCASWNVNGVRAATTKGLHEYLATETPDILCLQETKARADQFPAELTEIDGYFLYTAEAEKAGYSGVALFSKTEPDSVVPLDIKEFDSEGRALIADFGEFTVINAYFPNSQAEGKRLDYKLAFCDAVWSRADKLRAAGTGVVICGDFNIAHTEIDLANPKSNEKNPGFLPEERAWMTRFLGAGYVDTFRNFHPEPDNYSWWSYRMRARERNIGWRLDYHVVDESMVSRLVDARIRADVFGSDHCPVELLIE